MQGTAHLRQLPIIAGPKHRWTKQLGDSFLEATFFVCPREDAVGVSAIDDLPCEPVGESVRIESIGVLSALTFVLCGKEASPVTPLRDATCRSFPVFEFESDAQRALRDLSDDQIDEAARAWLQEESWKGSDVDWHEAACLLGETRAALECSESLGAKLFVLLEEKAF